MTRKLSIIIGLFIIMSFGFAQESQCSGQCQQKAMSGKEPMMKMQMLELTNEQREKIENSKYELEKKTIQLRADIQLKHLDLQKEMKAENPDRNKLMKLTKDISDIELKTKQLMLDHKLKVHSLLTPEQRKQMKHQPQEMMIKKKIIEKNCEGDCED